MPHGGEAPPRYLQTSPELHMKRLLARGYPDIFQICRVFRSGESGSRHNPEFAMLEWYRRGFSMEDLMGEVAEVCRAGLGERRVTTVAYSSLFSRVTGLDPLAVAGEQLRAYIASRETDPPPLAAPTDMMQYVMARWVEPSLPPGDITLVHSYPTDQAVLAAIDEQDPRVARRFEAYCGGMELANGWEELVDPDENRLRLEAENVKRMQRGRPPVPVDASFLEALSAGVPACAGVALGLDRLVMLAVGATRIDDVLTFPWDNT
jgi:lysyl-tRNA synthetase class 2